MDFAVQIQINHTMAGVGDPAKRRRRALERVDKELSRGNFQTALSLVKHLKAKTGGVRAFGSAKQVPRNLSSLEKFDFSGTDSSLLLQLVDSIMDSIQRCLEFTSLDELSAKSFESDYHEEDSESSYKNDHYMFVQHEAGHFLVGYLLGVLPRYYEVPSEEALRLDKSATGRVDFVGFEFLKEVGFAKKLQKDTVDHEMYHKSGQISSKALNNFSCVVLGGLVTEHMLFGYSEGLHSDVDKLDSVLRWLGYRESEANSQIRWATFNTIFLLHCHKEARTRLAAAMAMGKSVGSCIEAIENAIF